MNNWYAQANADDDHRTGNTPTLSKAKDAPRHASNVSQRILPTLPVGKRQIGADQSLRMPRIAEYLGLLGSIAVGEQAGSWRATGTSSCSRACTTA